VVEILKALYRGAKILILDEPTSALAPPETKKLLASIEAMANDELAVVPFITHKLPIVQLRRAWPSKWWVEKSSSGWRGRR
jgi:simple sugar transport system ATP-binding protein